MIKMRARNFLLCVTRLGMPQRSLESAFGADESRRPELEAGHLRLNDSLSVLGREFLKSHGVSVPDDQQVLVFSHTSVGSASVIVASQQYKGSPDVGINATWYNVDPRRPETMTATHFREIGEAAEQFTVRYS